MNASALPRDPHAPATLSPRDALGEVCVLGLGLIGGSILRDLAAAGVPCFGWNRSHSTVSAAAHDGFDVSADLPATLARAERHHALILLAVPVPALGGLLDAIALHAPTCPISDATSVKSEVHRLVATRGLTERFVGGHPMAGTADSGWSATMRHLFRDAVWVITSDGPDPRPASWTRAWVRVAALATVLEAAVVSSRADAHDAAVARVSHLPHVLAETLALTGDAGGPLALTLAASSFRDGTRVAGTAPHLVEAMCVGNHAALLNAVDEALAILTQARADLAAPDPSMGALATEGHAARGRFEARAGRNRGDAHNRPLIRVQPGAPGWVELLRSAESMGAQLSIF